jgi:hypothetical protein
MVYRPLYADDTTAIELQIKLAVRLQLNCIKKERKNERKTFIDLHRLIRHNNYNTTQAIA